MNQIDDEDWRKRVSVHDRALVTTIVSVLLLYLVGLVALIRLAFRPMEDNPKTLRKTLKDSGE